MNRNAFAHFAIASLVVFTFASCRKATTEQEPNTEQSPKDKQVTRANLPAASPGAFTLLDSEVTGIVFQNTVVDDHPQSRLYHSGFVCGAVAVGDVDGDGLADVYLASGADSNRLYKNLGDFQFRDITDQAKVEGDDRWGTGAVMVDIDNDGDLDIYVCNYDSPNLLYINDGKGVFSEESKRWGLDITDASLNAAFHDYDRDGDLDVYLLNNRFYRKGGRPKQPPYVLENGNPKVLPEFERYYALEEESAGKFSIDEYGRPDRLLRNEGTKFEDVTKAAGISGNGFGLSATWWDYDNDGWPDLYVCNDFNSPDRLYRNNRDGTFTDAIEQAVPHTPWFSMGSDFGDINNDGLIDFFCVDMSATTHFKQKTTMGAMSAERLARVAGPPPQYMRNALYLNTGTNRFMEIAYLAGVADSDWSWAAKLSDFDHDGLLDIFVSNGMVRNFNDSDVAFDDSMLVGKTKWDIYKHLPTRPEQNLAFRNKGDLEFEDVSKAWRLDHVGMSYGTVVADLDNDQDLDMIVMNIDEPVSVFRNDVAESPGMTVRLQGTQSNHYGWGARLELQTTSGTFVRYLNPTTGFLSCNQPIAHFGIPLKAQPIQLVIDWPSGNQQVVTELEARAIVVREASTDDKPIAANSKQMVSEPAFVEVATGPFQHNENDFDDFQLQPLLPNRLSQLGPGIAVADVNGDGKEDVFVGGSAGHANAVLFNAGNGTYVPRTASALVADSACEDMGCLFFDADSDGDQDIFVVSGGFESHDQPELLIDRFYENKGGGNYVKSVETVPQNSFSGSVVAANDFDRDGDLDIFVGGRVIPGSYPLSPGSRLYRNDGGRFTDVTAKLAAPLREMGMVTSAVWTDIDADGWDDLAIVGEWEPVHLLRNEQGQLVDLTNTSSTKTLTGWFNGITARDLDGDQDMDLVVTNAGLNTKYHANVKKPALLYYGDFDNSGSKRLVEAEYEDETLFPIRGKSCSTHAMPFLANRFKTYNDFALASLSELYSSTCLEDAYRLAAVELRSGVLINEGDFQFRFQPLPRIAQAAPGFGVIVTEVNGDSAPDIVIAQNFHAPQPETGNMDGGLGILLRGNGDGSFEPTWPAKSGIVIPGDATALAVTDANGDGLADLFVGVNSDSPQCFLRTSATGNVSVKLVGKPGNLHAVGAKVRVLLKNGSLQTGEVHAGGGYLTQSSASLEFGLDQSAVKEITVEWPDGTSSVHAASAGKNYSISWPSAK